MKKEHTPTPWIIDGEDSLQGCPFIAIHNSHAGNEAWRNICEVQPNTENGMSLVIGDEDRANAAFIVKAVNSHEALVEALRGLVEGIEANDPSQIRFNLPHAQAALKLAEAE